MDAADDEDSVNSISLKSDCLFGKQCDFPQLDKMCGMVIRIRNNENAAESRNKLIAMLEDLLSNQDSETKKTKLEEKYAMEITAELEGRFNSMCNLSEVVEERGIKKGMAQGIEQGIIALIEICHEFEHTKEETVSSIMKKFELSEETARNYVEKYWKE